MEMLCPGPIVRKQQHLTDPGTSQEQDSGGRQGYSGEDLVLYPTGGRFDSHLGLPPVITIRRAPAAVPLHSPASKNIEPWRLNNHPRALFNHQRGRDLKG